MTEQEVATELQSNQGVAGFLLGFGLFSVVFFVILLVLLIIAEWKIFTKAGKPGWHSIIPVLSTYDLFDLCWSKQMGIVGAVISAIGILVGGLSSYLQNLQQQQGSMVAMLIACAGIALLVVSVIGMWKLAKAFGHGVGFFLGLVFLPNIFTLILGFGASDYIGRGGDPNDKWNQA